MGHTVNWIQANCFNSDEKFVIDCLWNGSFLDDGVFVHYASVMEPKKDTVQYPLPKQLLFASYLFLRRMPCVG